jgi:hypothetical protein
MHAKDEEEEKKNKALEQAAAAAAAIDKLYGKGSPDSTNSPGATAGSPLKTIRIPRPKSRVFGAPRCATASNAEPHRCMHFESSIALLACVYFSQNVAISNIRAASS